MPQYSDDILDLFIGPKLSMLTHNGAPELGSQPDVLRAAIWGHICGLRCKRQALLHVSITLLKRSMTATNEYVAGRNSLTHYIDGLARRTHDVNAYLAALSHFEQCVGSVYHGVELFGKISKWLVPSHPLPFKKGDGSDLERLNLINNFIKHFAPEKAEATSAPVWITNTGLECATANLSFDELAENIKALWQLNQEMFIEIPRKASAPASGG